MLERVARQFIEKRGKRAVDVLRDHADLGATQGNGLSSQIWLDIADAAERLFMTIQSIPPTHYVDPRSSG